MAPFDGITEPFALKIELNIFDQRDKLFNVWDMQNIGSVMLIDFMSSKKDFNEFSK